MSELKVKKIFWENQKNDQHGVVLYPQQITLGQMVMEHDNSSRFEHGMTLQETGALTALLADKGYWH